VSNNLHNWREALGKFMATVRLHFGSNSTLYRSAERARDSGRPADLDKLVCLVLHLSTGVVSGEVGTDDISADLAVRNLAFLSTLATLRDSLFDLAPQPPVVSDERQYDASWRAGPDDLIA
jgi:hypothetical protein